MSKPDEWLQTNEVFKVESLSLFLAETPRRSHILTLKYVALPLPQLGLSTMPGHKKTGSFSLNLKTLINLYLVWKTIWKLKLGSLFFITQLILVKFEATVYRDTLVLTLSFFKALYLNWFSTLILSQKFPLCIYQRSHVYNHFYTRYLSIYGWSIGTAMT